MAAAQEKPVHLSQLHVSQMMALSLTDTYKRCNPDFKPMEKFPQRVLTVPSEVGTENSHDNADGNLICRCNDVLDSPNGSYVVLDILGTGTFGQVFRCQRSVEKDLVAVKVIKGKPAYRTQGLIEIKIAQLLNDIEDPDNSKHIVRVLESFEYKGHICIVFELLSISLLDVLTQNQFRGIPVVTVQRFAQQILRALVLMQDAGIIHCDLKPENILICPTSNPLERRDPMEVVEEGGTSVPQHPHGTGEWSNIKVIDFGSACYEGKTMYSYIQSRFYRSPEVLLGVPYNGAIDMWSFGCVCAEMFLGLPLFPGVSQHNQLSRIIEMLGPIPEFLIECGKNTSKYFTQNQDELVPMYSNKYRLKTPEEYAKDTNTTIPVLKKYLKYTELDDIILKCPLAKKLHLSQEQKLEEIELRKCFLNFLQGLLRANPFERWTAKQAQTHPFITGERFDPLFQPPDDPKIHSRWLIFTRKLNEKNKASPQRDSSNRQSPSQVSFAGAEKLMQIVPPMPIQQQQTSQQYYTPPQPQQIPLQQQAVRNSSNMYRDANNNMNNKSRNHYRATSNMIPIQQQQPLHHAYAPHGSAYSRQAAQSYKPHVPRQMQQQPPMHYYPSSYQGPSMMQAHQGVPILADFAQVLMRPDVDESRYLSSQHWQVSPNNWMNASYHDTLATGGPMDTPPARRHSHNSQELKSPAYYQQQQSMGGGLYDYPIPPPPSASGKLPPIMMAYTPDRRFDIPADKNMMRETYGIGRQYSNASASSEQRSYTGSVMEQVFSAQHQTQGVPPMHPYQHPMMQQSYRQIYDTSSGGEESRPRLSDDAGEPLSDGDLFFTLDDMVTSDINGGSSSSAGKMKSSSRRDHYNDRNQWSSGKR